MFAKFHEISKTRGVSVSFDHHEISLKVYFFLVKYFLPTKEKWTIKGLRGFEKSYLTRPPFDFLLTCNSLHFAWA